MIWVWGGGQIFNCYNGTTNASSGNCGFNIIAEGNEHALFSGVYKIDFGFQVSDRFVSVTAEYYPTANGAHNRGANYRFFDNTTVDVFTFEASNSGDTSAAPFMIIVY
jgi:hypothetical protein